MRDDRVSDQPSQADGWKARLQSPEVFNQRGVKEVIDPVDLLEGVSGGTQTLLIVESPDEAALSPLDEDYEEDSDSNEEDSDLGMITNDEIIDLLQEKVWSWIYFLLLPSKLKTLHSGLF